MPNADAGPVASCGNRSSHAVVRQNHCDRRGADPTGRGIAGLHRALATLILCLGASVAGAQSPALGPAADSLARAQANDNRRTAGTLRDRVLTVRLVARRARWHPEEEDGPSLVADAFGEEGRPLTIPAPLIRVPAGTHLVVHVRNELPDTLLLFGLRSRAASDTVRVAPGAAVETRAAAPPPGAYLYRGATLVKGEIIDRGYGQQLAGALVVDGPRPRPDRVLVISTWQAGSGPFVMAINGKSWPHTERFTMTVGDSVHWRVLSSSIGLHPMHLHGFYYRVDSKGSWQADTIYSRDARRHVVTEIVPGLGSISMTWIAERAGNWLYHCHDALHTTWRRRANLRGEAPGLVARPIHDAAHHAEQDMSGLVIGIHVNPKGTELSGADVPRAEDSVRRRMRVVVNEKARFYRQQPAYSFVRADAGSPAVDSIEIPGRPIVMTRGQPAEITVVNRASVPTAVHWHGIELESYFDGVAGFGGLGTRRSPLIAPADSFAARFTPPRAGTFIYHAHIDDQRQIALGLYGPLIVVERGTRIDSTTDHILLFSQLGPGAQGGIGLNGTAKPPALELRADVTHRLRFINIAIQDLIDLRVTATTDSIPVTWRALAKDGRDLEQSKAVRRPATLLFGPGETYDFELSLPRGDYRLTLAERNDFVMLIRVR